MKVLSVNVGKPQPNPWKHISATGIEKRQVDGPVFVAPPGPKGTGEVGLAGDRVFDVRHHGGPDQAVYAYAREDLDAWQAETGADLAKVNINGGAIALGHPLGASGARLMTTLVSVLEQTGERYGLQTMCEAGGLANATIIERL